jgi:FAD/FMN-containing dehydrogenase
MTLEALAEAVRSSDRVCIAGSGSKTAFGLPVSGVEISTSGLEGVICYEPDDRVVEVWAGTKIDDLQQVLSEKGQCLPIPSHSDFGSLLAGVPGTIGGLVSMNLPHGLSAQNGGPKEWVLGAKVMRSRGEVVKSGGKVVKNVAGFDFHRFVVGARGSMGLVVSVTLKVSPVKSVPSPVCRFLREWDASSSLVVQRVLPADFDQARSAVEDRLYALDPASYTLWFSPDTEIKRYESDWLIGANRGSENLSFGPTQTDLFKQAKQAVDPHTKFNSGVFGCI